MEKRYLRNLGALTEEEMRLIAEKSVLIVGLGGLGGYNAEYLARLGVGELRICDSDVFDETNLNRQINALSSTIGKSKVDVARERINAIDPLINVVCFDRRFDRGSAAEIVKGADVIIDALDNIESRIVLEQAASDAGIPLVFGAISDWCGQVMTVLPKTFKIKKLYENSEEIVPPVLSFCAAAISAFQSAEAVKMLLGRPDLTEKMLLVHLDSNEIVKVKI